MAWGIILALALSLLVAAVSFHFLRKLAPIILHGIIGLALFWLLSFIGVLHVPIDLATFLIAALGGIPGVLIVLALSFFGIPL